MRRRWKRQIDDQLRELIHPPIGGNSRKRKDGSRISPVDSCIDHLAESLITGAWVESWTEPGSLAIIPVTHRLGVNGQQSDASIHSDVC